MSADLPSDLRRGLDALTEGKSRNAIAERAAALSQLYRGGRRTADAVRTADDALAYALVRMPATYAAAAAVLAALAEVCPNFSPRTLLDIGAGPGTATFAAARHFTDLRRIRLVDADPHLRALALALLRSSESAVLHDAAYETGEIASLRHDGESADLVMASYVIGEIAPDALGRAADALWSRTACMLVVIEPGTPAGFERIRALRAHLLAQGAHVACPCPHDAACPIVAPDWCHFSQRLNRSRDHRQVKGASLSFEDEKFSYVVLGRDAPARIDARVLAHPDVTKSAITAKLCVADGIVNETTARRDREAYRLRKSWRWGDAVTRPDKPE